MNDLCVARFNEDIAWTKQVHGWNVCVYDKGAGGTLRNELHGREAHTYLLHIVLYYDVLPPEVAFAQGNPFDHCPTFLEDIRNPDIRNYGYIAGCDARGMPHCDFADLHNWCAALELPLLDEYRFVAGAQFRITREQIRAHSRDFYVGLLLASKVKPHAAYSLERLWSYIFGMML